MKKILVGLLVLAFGVTLARAQASSAVVPTAAQSGERNSQLTACNNKVSDLANQFPPLQKKRTALWAERKTIGTSGGDSAKYKLAGVDQDIAQVTKQIDGVTRQIDSEKRRCDELASKASGARSGSQAQPSSQAQQSGKPKGNGRRH